LPENKKGNDNNKAVNKALLLASSSSAPAVSVSHQQSMSKVTVGAEKIRKRKISPAVLVVYKSKHMEGRALTGKSDTNDCSEK
jgi:hypothetical protein